MSVTVITTHTIIIYQTMNIISVVYCTYARERNYRFGYTTNYKPSSVTVIVSREPTHLKQKKTLRQINLCKTDTFIFYVLI